MADVGKFVRIFDVQPGYIFHSLNQKHFTRRQLSHRTFYFDVAFVADHDDFVILLIEAGYFFMDFGYQRAGGIKNAETTLRRFFLYGFGYAVSRVNQRCALWDIRQVIDKYSTFCPQIVHDEFVVNDLMADVNRRAEFFECTFNNTDGTVNAGTEAAGIGKDNGFLSHVCSVFRRPLCRLKVFFCAANHLIPSKLRQRR